MGFSLIHHEKQYTLSSGDWKWIIATFGSGAPLAWRHFELAYVPGQSAWRHRAVGVLQFCPFIGAPLCLAEYIADCFGYLTLERPIRSAETRFYKRIDTAPLMALLQARAGEIRPCDPLPTNIRFVQEVSGAEYAATGRAFLQMLTQHAAPNSCSEVQFATVSALHLAIRHQREDFMDAVLKTPWGMELLNRGTTETNMTPITFAAFTASVIKDPKTADRMQRIAEKLLTFQPDLNRTNLQGRTPLTIAAMLENFALSKKLLLLGGTVALENGSPKELNEAITMMLATARAELVKELGIEVAKLDWIPDVLRPLILDYVL